MQPDQTLSEYPVAVLGAGAWGTALACHLAARREVRLWSRHDADAMQASRVNARYLPGVVLPERLRVTPDLAECLGFASSGLIVVATPVAGLRDILGAIARTSPSGAQAPLVGLAKGFEADSGMLPHEVAADVVAGWPYGVVSGPSFAQEVAAGLPVALVAASAEASVAQRAVDALHGGAMRVYRSSDVIGVEVGGALKNVVAIAAGIADGLALGANARAALMTRGLAEITRLGVALGAQRETFMGLAGMGDLVLTCAGDLSRNRRVGLGLARGEPIARIVTELGHVAEGVACVRAAIRRADEAGVAMPIAQAVCAVIESQQAPREAVDALLARDPAVE